MVGTTWLRDLIQIYEEITAVTLKWLEWLRISAPLQHIVITL
jgi:hypothetical protein